MPDLVPEKNGESSVIFTVLCEKFQLERVYHALALILHASKVGHGTIILIFHNPKSYKHAKLDESFNSRSWSKKTWRRVFEHYSDFYSYLFSIRSV
jgi:hypothetical protein